MKYSIRAVIGALAMALLAAFVVYRVASQQPSQQASGVTTRTVLVATKAIPAGMTLAQVRDGGYASAQQRPSLQVPSDSLGAITADIESKVSVAPLQEGDILSASNFAETLVNSGPLSVPSGSMAISLDMPDPAKVGSFLRPGAEITIFSTVIVPAGTNGQATETKATKILFPRVKVVAVGPAVTRAEADQVTSSGNMLITVVVTPKQAQKLVYALQNTTLYFGLLNGETDVPPTGTVDGQNLFDGVN
jgi:pilus assembly protein CpaB